MKAAVLLGSLLIGGLIAAIPAYNEGFSSLSISEWFFNTLFVTAILGYLGMKFLLNEPSRSGPRPSIPKNKKKK